MSTMIMGYQLPPIFIFLSFTVVLVGKYFVGFGINFKFIGDIYRSTKETFKNLNLTVQ